MQIKVHGALSVIDGFDSEAKYNSKPVSYLRLKADENTVLDEIEDTFENALVALGEKYF